MNEYETNKESSLNEQQLLQQTEELVAAREAQLDAGTLSRLHRIRSEALTTVGGRPAKQWLPVAGAVTVAMLVGVVLFLPQQPANLNPETALVTGLSEQDLELLVGSEDLELLEDLEFYLWLDSQGPLDRPS